MRQSPRAHGQTACIFSCLALFAFVLASSPTLGGPSRMQCWDCLQHLATQLPAANPQEDPTYEQGLTPGSVLPALAECSLDNREIPDLKRIIQVFNDAQVSGGGPIYVQQHLEQLPQVSPADRAKLVDGARKDLDTTLRHLTDHNCQILLQSHFGDGASRSWLLHMINLGRKEEGQ